MFPTLISNLKLTTDENYLKKNTPKSQQLPLTRSNIPAAPSCGAYISQLVHYSNPGAQTTVHRFVKQR